MKLPTNDDVVFHIHGEGDTSVGIWPPEATLILRGQRRAIADDPEYKESLREGLRTLFKEMWDDGKVSVALDEEVEAAIRAENKMFEDAASYYEASVDRPEND